MKLWNFLAHFLDFKRGGGFLKFKNSFDDKLETRKNIVNSHTSVSKIAHAWDEDHKVVVDIQPFLVL